MKLFSRPELPDLDELAIRYLRPGGIYFVGGLLAVGKLSADRWARFQPPLPVSR